MIYLTRCKCLEDQELESFQTPGDLVSSISPEQRCLQPWVNCALNITGCVTCVSLTCPALRLSPSATYCRALDLLWCQHFRQQGVMQFPVLLGLLQPCSLLIRDRQVLAVQCRSVLGAQLVSRASHIPAGLQTPMDRFSCPTQC